MKVEHNYDYRKGCFLIFHQFQLTKELPTMVHLFTTTEPVPLTLKMVTNLLTPQFSPEGSNRRKLESAVYSTFIKYMREAASK